jgi:hypothetical protein
MANTLGSSGGVRREETAAIKPRNWWQWLLLYPALATSVVAAIPTIIESVKAYKLGVDFGKADLAEQQNKLWQKNLTCAQSPFDWFTNDDNVQIDATICKSGDVLVRVKRPATDYHFRWVQVDSVIKEKTTASLWPFSVAYASEPIKVAQGQPPICQYFVQPGIVALRYWSPSGCFEDLINTFTGQTVGRRLSICARC